MIDDYKTENVWLMKGDCLERMKEIQSGSADMILADVPYGTTACAWDSIIPLEPMWEQLKRIIKPNGAIVMTASQPFTTTLIASNIKMFKYCWVWEKSRFANQMLAKIQPLKIHEDIVIFSNGTAKYYPQGLIGCNKITRQGANVSDNNGGGKRKTEYLQTNTNYPRTIQKFKSESKTIHSTQKPVALMEYLIKTYTNETETVLDFTFGSGTTGVACKNLNRKFIGIELDDHYFEIGKNRILAD